MLVFSLLLLCILAYPSAARDARGMEQEEDQLTNEDP